MVWEKMPCIITYFSGCVVDETNLPQPSGKFKVFNSSVPPQMLAEARRSLSSDSVPTTLSVYFYLSYKVRKGVLQKFHLLLVAFQDLRPSVCLIPLTDFSVSLIRRWFWSTSFQMFYYCTSCIHMCTKMQARLWVWRLETAAHLSSHPEFSDNVVHFFNVGRKIAALVA